MSLNDYNAATFLMESMNHGAQFVRVIAGEREGTIGRVEEVRTKYYSVHDFKLHVTGRRPFWVKGSNLEHLKEYKGHTHWAVNRETPFYNDLTGRRIELGHTLLFPRVVEGGKVEMAMGTVKKISQKGTIYAKMFMNSQNGNTDLREVRVGKPASAVILDKSTVDQVMLAKLSCF